MFVLRACDGIGMSFHILVGDILAFGFFYSASGNVCKQFPKTSFKIILQRIIALERTGVRRWSFEKSRAHQLRHFLSSGKRSKNAQFSELVRWSNRRKCANFETNHAQMRSLWSFCVLGTLIQTFVSVFWKKNFTFSELFACTLNTQRTFFFRDIFIGEGVLEIKQNHRLKRKQILNDHQFKSCATTSVPR